ncbi:hypothetical protein TB2_036952 [Malus domestica]
MDLVYEDKPSSQTFEDLEKKFLDDIRNLAKEQSDAEDVENARHRELDNFGIVFGWTQWSRKIQNLMDNEVLCKDVSGEQARESLIVISDPVADQVLDLSFLPALLDRVAAANRDGHEKYVSELMSISNLQSPDIKTRLFAIVLNLHIRRMMNANEPDDSYYFHIVIVDAQNRKGLGTT